MALSTLCSPSAEAVQGYLKFGGSAATAVAGEMITVRSTSTDSLDSTDRAFYSVGQGVSADGAVGFVIAEHFALELGVGYLYGLNTVATYDGSFGSASYHWTDTVSGSLLRFTPAIVVSTELGAFSPYSRFGVVLGIARATHRSDDLDSGTTTVRESEFTGGLAVGLSGACGLDFAVSDRWSLFAELSFMAMSYSPTDGRVTVSTENGVDKLGTMTTREKEVEFRDSRVENTSSQPSEGMPDQSSSISIPFSNVGFGVGLKFRL